MEKTRHEQLVEQLLMLNNVLGRLLLDTGHEDVFAHHVKRLEELKKSLKPLGVEFSVLDWGTHFHGHPQTQLTPCFLIKTDVANIDIKKGKLFNTLRVYDDEQDYFWLEPKKHTVHLMNDKQMEYLTDTLKEMNALFNQPEQKPEILFSL